ncbi:hypothetical protein JET18_09790 [Chryseobacterium sp. L7]|uniref:Uncharacterized protein n=1 Tax=Chryseobacterium endalhagicum TaxID=2797638 RepID=A0ABS1QEX3_9FLAO|nr:hypothetical protein [Chryseobacterium endalhagicum]MBL1221131.1 hypothetical protein [Chryseobacterium endalhagicum]
MHSISKKIKIGNPISPAKNHFSNDEMIPSAATTFICVDCGHENAIEIIPYETGFPIFQLYHEDKVLSKSELLNNRMATKTAPGMLHFGEITVNNLPTLYFGTECKTCQSKYLCIFSYGEKQPGLTLLNISGIWKYEELE